MTVIPPIPPNLMASNDLTYNAASVTLPAMKMITPSSFESAPLQESARMLYIPIGLVLLFFGCFILKPVIFTSFVLILAEHLFLYQTFQHRPLPMILIRLALAAAPLYMVLHILREKRSRPHSNYYTGMLVGLLVSFTWYHYSTSLLTRLASTITLCLFFAYVFHFIPVEAAVFLSAFAGAFLMFHGIAAIDTCTTPYCYPAPRPVPPPSKPFPATAAAPHHAGTAPYYLGPAPLHLTPSYGLWFSVLSFLVVGVLGCAVQIMLLSSQEERSVSRSQYVIIP